MPHEYFDRYVFECWAIYSSADLRRFSRLKTLDGEGKVHWYAFDEEDRRIYAYEVRDPQTQVREAWTFIIERDGALEVEELYVRPKCRRFDTDVGWPTA